MSLVIVGAGRNLSAAVAPRLGREAIYRDAAKLEALAGELAAEGLRVALRAAGIRDATALSEAIASPAGDLGPVEVLEYSPLPARELMRPILETTVDDVRGPLEFSVLGAVPAEDALERLDEIWPGPGGEAPEAYAW